MKKPIVFRFFLASAFIGAAMAQPAMEGRLYIPPPKIERKAIRADLPSARLTTSAPRRTDLPELEVGPLRVPNASGQIPVGTARDLAVESPGSWEMLPGGRLIWRAAFRSPGAVGIRARVDGFAVGRGRVWTYGPRDAEADSVYTDRGPYNDGEFWTGTVAGDTIVIEYEPETPPAGDGPPPFRVASVAHLWEGPQPLASPEVQQAAGCHVDFKCESSWGEIGRGVAHIRYVRFGVIYDCSGALLNNRSDNRTPYFLTANHCISTDDEARSVEAYFSYETSQCNGPHVTTSVAARVDGARLLTTGLMSQGDYSLLRLNGLPDVPVQFAGWTTQEPPLGTALTGIHHPAGSYKRISFGQRTTDRNTEVGFQFAPASSFFQVMETRGRVEGGSSGSALYLENGQIVGVLSHGPIPRPGRTVCDIEPFEAAYGRFSVAYPALLPYVEGASEPPLNASPSSLSFRAVNRVFQAPAALPVRVETTSTSPVLFAVVPGAAWVRPSVTSGTVVAGSPATFDVSIDLTKQSSIGRHQSSVLIWSGLSQQTVNVQLEVSVTRPEVVARLGADVVNEETPDAEGNAWFYDVRVTETAGVDAFLRTLRIDGVDYSAEIFRWFTSSSIPAFGSVIGSFRAKDVAVPAERTIELGGLDWSAQVTVRFLGRRTQPRLRMTLTPSPVYQNPASEDCPWRHEVILSEDAGFPVTLNRWVVGGSDLSAEISSRFGTTRLAALGAARASLCWTGVEVPATRTFDIGGRDDRGNEVNVTGEVQLVGIASQPLLLRIVPERLSFYGRTDVANAGIHIVQIDSGPARWTARITYQGAARNWLSASPLSGLSASRMRLEASREGLPVGRYTATITIETPGVSQVEIPVTLTVGPRREDPRVTALVNAASFQETSLVPGMLLTIFGENLATSEAVASGVPLPYTMGDTLVMIGNVYCPLLYVSPRQINVQVPYELQPGPSSGLAVTVFGGGLSRGGIRTAGVSPGVFTLDGVRPAPQPSGARGQELIAYLTGVGAVTPLVATGEAPAPGTIVEKLPRPISTPVEVTVAGMRAEVLFAGIPQGLIGVVQVNYRVPENAPLGNQPVLFTVGRVAANRVMIEVR